MLELQMNHVLKHNSNYVRRQHNYFPLRIIYMVAEMPVQSTEASIWLCIK